MPATTKRSAYARALRMFVARDRYLTQHTDPRLNAFLNEQMMLGLRCTLHKWTSSSRRSMTVHGDTAPQLIRAAESAGLLTKIGRSYGHRRLQLVVYVPDADIAD